jgi:hypothetical protein
MIGLAFLNMLYLSWQYVLNLYTCFMLILELNKCSIIPTENSSVKNFLQF